MGLLSRVRSALRRPQAAPTTVPAGVTPPAATTSTHLQTPDALVLPEFAVSGTPARAHLRLRRWGVDTSEYDVVVALAVHRQCSHPAGPRLLSSLELHDLSPSCPALALVDVRTQPSQLTALAAQFEQFEAAGTRPPSTH